MHSTIHQIEVTKKDTGHFFCPSTQVWLFDSRIDSAKKVRRVKGCVWPMANKSFSLTAFSLDQRGFTLVELITVMILVGIMAAISAPRFFDANTFQSRGFADQVQATLRYAQKEAIAQHRNVCVAITSSTISLTIASFSGIASGCSPALNLPAGGNSISAPPGSGITLTLAPAAPSTFNYDALGKPFDTLGTTPSTVQKSITLNGGTANIIYVEAETGYVHSP